MNTRYDEVKAIICDLDGTLCLIEGRNPYDAANCWSDRLNDAINLILNNYRIAGNSSATSNSVSRLIILCSGRSNSDRQPTLNWLKAHNIDYDYLFMRNTGDKRKDSIVKKEILENEIYGKLGVDKIDFVLDDRQQVVDMWRAEGITCLQVAPSPDMEELAIIQDAEYGLRDVGRPVLSFTVATEHGSALQVFSQPKADEILIEANAREVKNLNGKACLIERKGNIMTYKRMAKL